MTPHVRNHSDGRAAGSASADYTARLEDDGILVLTVSGPEVDGRKAQAIVDHLFSLAGDRRYPVLIKIGGVRWVSREVSPIADTFPSAGLALLGRGPVDRIIGNFFLRAAMRDGFPARYFDDEAKARAWLATFPYQPQT